MFCTRPLDTSGFHPAGLLLPDLKHIVNILRAEIRPIHDPVEDPHLCLATLVVELCHSVIVSTWANIKEPAVRLAFLAEADNPAKRLAQLIQYPWLLKDNRVVCCHEVQANAANFHCGQEHDALRCVLELIQEFHAIVRGVVRQHLHQVHLGKVMPQQPLNMPHLAGQWAEHVSLLSQQ